MIKINKHYALASASFALLLFLAPATLQAHDLIICKASDTTSPVTGSFRFHVLGTGYVDVAVGACSTLVAIGEGSHTIVEESTEGTEVTKIDVSPAADKVSVDPGARMAVVTLSDVTGPTTLTYTNGAVGCGRYTGGGSIFTSAGVRVTHGFELHCSIADLPNNLEINFDANSFHLESLTSVHCTFPSGIPTITGTGTGRYNGVSGAAITFLFTDEGEPGKDDDASYLIVAGGSTVLSTPPTDLTFGNQQFHAKGCKVK